MLQKAFFEMTRFLNMRRSIRAYFYYWKDIDDYSQSSLNAKTKLHFRIILRSNISYQKFIAIWQDISQILMQNLIKTVKEADVAHNFFNSSI